MSQPMNLTDKPGGDQDVLAGLPAGLKACLQRARRVVLLANNPAISAADVAALSIGAEDVVVSFNTCVQAELLTADAVNVFVHGFNAPDHYFFGLPYQPAVQRLFQQQPERCFSVLVGCTQPLCPLPQTGLYRERIPLPALWNYPVDRPNGKRYVGPSTGFNMLVLLDWLRAQPGYGYQLLTLGFSNEAGKLWGGHAWDYERAWLVAADVTVVALARRSRWQTLLGAVRRLGR